MGALGAALGSMVANLSYTNGDGTTVGKNLAIGLKKEKYIS